MDKKYFLKNSDYFGWGIKKPHLDRERVKILNKYLTGRTVLDVGCGSGVYVNYLVKKKIRATGIDFIEKFIKFARENYKGKYFVADIYNLPFKDNSFDTVISFDVLEHLKYELKALKEMRRVAKKRIVLIIPRRTDKELDRLGLIFKHYLDRTHLRYYNREYVMKLAEKSDLKVSKLIKLRKISIETLFIKLFKGPFLFKKIFYKFLSVFLKPLNFYFDLVLIADIPH